MLVLINLCGLVPPLSLMMINRAGLEVCPTTVLMLALPGSAVSLRTPVQARLVGGGHHEHMDSLVSTSVLLVSALTSAFVALAVEWLAKPRLEARKESLLVLHRGRRTFEKNLNIILCNAAKLATGAAHGIPRGTEEELRRAIRAEANRAATQIEAATKDMSDNFMDYALTYATDRIRNLIIRYTFTARGIAISTRTQVEKAEILKEITVPINIWLFARWRPIARLGPSRNFPKFWISIADR